MTTHRFVGLSQRLLRAGVSSRHVKRLTEELEAHFADLVEELRSTGLSQAESESKAAARLGTEEVLAASILARPELRSWARQWPWLAFVVLPLVSLLAQFVLSMAAAVGVLSFAKNVLGLSALHPGPIPGIVQALQAYALWIAPVVAAGATWVFAAHRSAPLLWPILGSALIGLVGAMTNASFRWSAADPRGVLSAGIGVPGQGPARGLRLTLTLGIILVAFLWLRSRANGANRAYPP
jgi:hypothetical protein